MFQSRQKASFLDKLGAFFWPKAGWKRSTKYVAHRVARIKGSPYSIACGFACGAAISFTPFVGTHFFGGALMSLILRGNVLASVIGTFVGNPWTFPLIWIFIYKLGLAMGADGGVENSAELDFLAFFDALIAAVKTFNWQFIVDTAWPVIWPMMVGSVPCFFVVWFLSFFPVRYLVQSYHDKRAKKRAARVQKFSGKQTS